MDIGVESYKIAASIKGVVAQRLVRRLCSHCRELSVGQVPDRLKKWFPDGSTLYRAAGCSECSNTGYRGRLAITEVLISTPEVERRIAANESAERLADAGREGGMRGLFESCVQHVRNGVTTIDELVRVLEVPGEPEVRASTTASRASQLGDTVVSEEPGASHGAPTEASARLLGGEILPPPRRGQVQTLHATPPSMFTGESFQLVDEENVNANGESKKVLLVEDEDALRRVLKDLLEREGFTVFEAADGVVALDEIDRAAPDIVVLDLNLPRLDGYGVLSHLRARPATAELPVIVLTAKGDEDSEVRVFEYGASDYLTKPFRPRALSARLHSLLGRTKG
jgi:type IV pilus assembly protein PilB